MMKERVSETGRTMNTTRRNFIGGMAAGGFASFRAAATTYTYTVDHVKWSYTIANDVATITSAVVGKLN